MSETGNSNTADFLLTRGANRNAKGRCGKTAMQFPVIRDDAIITEWLINQGFDFGDTALIDAVDESAVACFKVLIEVGADWKKRSQIWRPSHQEGRPCRNCEDLS